MLDIFLDLLDQALPTLFYLLALVIIFYGRRLLKVWVPKIESWIEANINETTKKIIQDLGQEAFAYAETVYREKNGAEKLKEALAYFNQHMSKYGLTNLNTDVIRAAIERAWLEDKRKELPVVELEELKIGVTE